MIYLKTILNKSVGRVSTRGFASVTKVNFAKAVTKKATAFTKSAQAHVQKSISNEEVQPVDWKYERAISVPLPELNSETATKENVNTVFNLTIKSTISKKGSNSFENLPKHLKKEFDFTCQFGLLFRQINLELFDLVNKSKDAAMKLPLILDGKTGTGKSASLIQTVSYCNSKKNWIVVYSPNTLDWVNGTSPYSYDKINDVYVQPELTSSFLKEILNVNSKILEKVLLESDLILGTTTLSKGASLAKVLEAGISDINLSYQALDNFLKIVSKQTEYPVLLALDQINCIHSKSAYFDQTSKMLISTKLGLVKLFSNFIEGKNQLNKGLILGANTWSDNKYANKNYHSLSSTPTEFKNINGTSFLGLTVPNYTKEEAIAVSKYYKDAQLIFNEWSETETDRKLLVSNGNAKEFFKSYVCIV